MAASPDQPDTVTRLLLVRHGESNVTVQRVLGGELSDTGLSELGRRQSRALRDRLEAEGAHIDVVVSSTLARAYETAEIVAPAFGISEIEQESELMERRPGEADGMTFTAYREKYGDGIFSDPHLELAPGGESAVGFHARTIEAFGRVMARHRGRSVIVFCHGGVIDVAFREFLDTSRHDGFELWTLNTSLSEFLCIEGDEASRWRLVRYNDAAHLAGLPTKTVTEADL